MIIFIFYCQEPPVVCPFDSNHRMSLDSLEHHLDRCQWKAEGYVEGDLPLSIPSVPPNALSCIKFGKTLKNNVKKKTNKTCQ